MRMCPGFSFFKNSFRALLFFTLLLSHFGCSQSEKTESTKRNYLQNLLDVDFDRSMGGKSYAAYRSLLIQENACIQRLKKMYIQNKPSRVAATREGKIPKSIHQIWLGPKPVPPHLEELSKSFRKLHPDWEYHVWTDEKIGALDFEMKELFYSSASFQENSEKRIDILRAEILDRFGGAVVDLDFEAKQPLDCVHAKYDFYTSLSIPQNENSTLFSTKIVAAKAGHPIIKEWKKELASSRNMAFQSAVVKKFGSEYTVDIVFPASYFYPISQAELNSWVKHKPSKIKNCIHAVLEFLHLKSNAPFSEVKPESLAVCYWGGNILKTKEQCYYELFQELQTQQKELSKEIRELQAEIQKLKNEQRERT